MEDHEYRVLGLFTSKNKVKFSKIEDGLIYFFKQLFLMAIACMAN